MAALISPEWTSAPPEPPVADERSRRRALNVFKRCEGKRLLKSIDNEGTVAKDTLSTPGDTC